MYNFRNNFNVTLVDRTSDWMRKQIESGTFDNVNEVIDTALSEMMAKDKKKPRINQKKK